jgi:hypothetical protein
LNALLDIKWFSFFILFFCIFILASVAFQFSFQWFMLSLLKYLLHIWIFFWIFSVENWLSAFEIRELFDCWNLQLKICNTIYNNTLLSFLWILKCSWAFLEVFRNLPKKSSIKQLYILERDLWSLCRIS